MRANQVVLLGDQCQLPPTTSSEDAKKQNVAHGFFLVGWEGLGDAQQTAKQSCSLCVDTSG